MGTRLSPSSWPEAEMADAVYPGTFDPVHNGHLDIVNRASRLFDRLLVGVYESPPKSLLFSTEERVELFKASVVDIPNVEVVPFKELAVKFARRGWSAVHSQGVEGRLRLRERVRDGADVAEPGPGSGRRMHDERAAVPVRVLQPHQGSGKDVGGHPKPCAATGGSRARC